MTRLWRSSGIPRWRCRGLREKRLALTHAHCPAFHVKVTELPPFTTVVRAGYAPVKFGRAKKPGLPYVMWYQWGFGPQCGLRGGPSRRRLAQLFCRGMEPVSDGARAIDILCRRLYLSFRLLRRTTGRSLRRSPPEQRFVHHRAGARGSRTGHDVDLLGLERSRTGLLFGVGPQRLRTVRRWRRESWFAPHNGPASGPGNSNNRSAPVRRLRSFDASTVRITGDVSCLWARNAALGGGVAHPHNFVAGTRSQAASSRVVKGMVWSNAVRGTPLRIRDENLRIFMIVHRLQRQHG